MSIVKFFPVCWFEDSSWKSMQVFGRLANGNSIYIRIGFKPYLTVQYPDDMSEEAIEDTHTHLLGETPVSNIVQVDSTSPVYRIYVQNKDDYFDTSRFFQQNRLGQILDRDQNIKSKFFTENRIDPGSWQEASNLHTLHANVSTGQRYSTADLEYFSSKIRSLNDSTPIPQTVNAFYDIEVRPSDDVSFPDAENEQPPDSIFSISLIVQTSNDVQMIVYFLANFDLEENYQTHPERTDQSYPVKIVTVHSEKDLLEKFFEGLVSFKPDRLISMNGRRFDLNYIGIRARSLHVKVPHLSKVRSYEPYFYQITIEQTIPFPSSEQIWTWNLPGISQIDILDFYRRIYPQLGNHKLETLGQIILGRGKTGLSIPEMFARYQKGTQEDYEVIIDYSIVDSILLMDLWEKTKIPEELSRMSNFWKNDSEYVITNSKDDLFFDLIRYITPVPPPIRYRPGKAPLVERKPGIHRNVYLYSLSNIYLTFLEQLNDPLADYLVKYFENSNDGVVPFKSGLFPVRFEDVVRFINSQIGGLENPDLVWVEENSLAVQGEPYSPGKTGPYSIFRFVDFIPLIIVVNKSWILINSSGVIFKKGLSAAIRPPFKLLQKYLDYLVQELYQNPDSDITFPEIPSELDDFVMEMKVNAQDFIQPSDRKKTFIEQLQQIRSPVTNSWRKVRYIQTKKGPVIEEIYSQDPEKYISQLDVDWYNKSLARTIRSITG